MIDREALAFKLNEAVETIELLEPKGEMSVLLNADEARALLTALASQEGAQVGEVVKQWRGQIGDAWTDWIDGELSQGEKASFERIRYRTVTVHPTLADLEAKATTPPAPDEAVRVAVEAEREACIAAVDAVVPYSVTEGGVMHRQNALSEGYYDWIDKHEALEALRARKGGTT